MLLKNELKGKIGRIVGVKLETGAVEIRYKHKNLLLSYSEVCKY